jgi:integrase/recombinase XerD
MASNLTKRDTGEIVLSKPLEADQNPAAVYLASLKAGSRRSQLQALNKMAELLTGGRADAFSISWAALRYQHTAALRAKLQELYSPATANKFLCALRRTLKEAWRLGLMSADDYSKAADLETIKGDTLPAGRELTPGEILALMADCEADTTAAGARDAAIIGLMYSGGPRRDEIVKIDLKDYDQDSGQLKVLHAKRSKQRTIYLINGAFDALADWLSVRGSKAGPLFVAINKGGKIDRDYKQLTSQAIFNMLAKRAASAGVKEFSPHDLRRSFISDLLEAGADIATVAKMAGHSSVSTTARYDRRPEAAKQKAASLLHVPYTKRAKS